MKVVAYIVCIFGAALVFALLGGTTNIGAIPSVIIYGIFLWLARLWCKSIDAKKVNNKTTKNDAIDKSSDVIYNNKDDSNYTVVSSETIVNNGEDCAAGPLPVKTDVKETPQACKLEQTETSLDNSKDSVPESDSVSDKIDKSLDSKSQEQIAVSKEIFYCRKCGYKLKPNSVFCSKCGVKVE